jgi:hypothetical protein
MGQVNISGDYVLSFDITPRGINGSWANIVHFNMVNHPYDGSRCPAIWFWPGGLGLHVRIGDTNDWNWGQDSNPLPINQKSSFRLECVGKRVTMTVNSSVWNETQPTTRARGLANVYGSNPWYVPATADIENFCYQIR